MLLRHLHLPALTSYTHAAALQDRFVRQFFAHKASPTTTAQPEPIVLTAQFHPVYTCGRREVNSVSAKQKAYLTAKTPLGQADFHEALRGGQTTFHGPGQLVAYPILDLRRHALSPRCYVNLLEEAVIQTCRRSFGIETMRTDNPGVWTDDTHKICAVGVHLRRNIASHGIGLNVRTELGWFDRIVACGLEGKRTTSLQQQGVGAGLDVEYVAGLFVKHFAEGLEGVDKVVRVDEAAVD